MRLATVSEACGVKRPDGPTVFCSQPTSGLSRRDSQQRSKWTRSRWKQKVWDSKQQLHRRQSQKQRLRYWRPRSSENSWKKKKKSKIALYLRKRSPVPNAGRKRRCSTTADARNGSSLANTDESWAQQLASTECSHGMLPSITGCSTHCHIPEIHSPSATNASTAST